MYRKILIANRGEIACRIARTVRRMGLAVATVHSQADAQALHVREIGESVLLGEAPARASYLNIDAVVQAARRVGADAVHPGFGFLSENAAFARACAEAGLAFIGPAPETLALFGDKAAAKRLARELGIPTAGGVETPTDDVGALLSAVRELARPFILKAVAGGGGKGMRVVRDGEDPRPAIEAAIREGRSAFGDGRLIAERYLAAPRHIEVQILGDGAGGVLHLHDRECSLQRRYQKVVEEAPVTSLPAALRAQLLDHALALGRASRYLGLGTVEFAVSEGAAVFLEVNPRLQVEHPVTEAVTGLDLVELQIRTVEGRCLPFAQADVPEPQGVAVQARLYAEDAAQGFLPATGRITCFEAPESVRVDTGVATGDEITPHYDPMIAKVIAHGGTRADALRQMRLALGATTVLGVTCNRAFLLRLLADPHVIENDMNTETVDAWLPGHPEPAATREQVAALAALWMSRRRVSAPQAGAWQDPRLTGWSLTRGAGLQAPPATQIFASHDMQWRVGMGAGSTYGSVTVTVDGEVFQVEASAPSGGRQTVNVSGHLPQLRAHVDETQVFATFGEADVSLDVRPLHSATGGTAASQHGVVRAPMMGVVIAVHVAEGEQVDAGARLGTMESMKMEMALTAPVAGRVTRVGCTLQGKVERHQELFHIEAAA